MVPFLRKLIAALQKEQSKPSLRTDWRGQPLDKQDEQSRSPAEITTLLMSDLPDSNGNA